MSLEELEKAAALQILVYLTRKDGATRTDLKENVRAAIETIYSALEVLKRLGLIEEEASRNFPFPVIVRLTSLGRRVAEHIAEVERLLKAGG